MRCCCARSTMGSPWWSRSPLVTSWASCLVSISSRQSVRLSLPPPFLNPNFILCVDLDRPHSSRRYSPNSIVCFTDRTPLTDPSDWTSELPQLVDVRNIVDLVICLVKVLLIIPADLILTVDFLFLRPPSPRPL